MCNPRPEWLDIPGTLHWEEVRRVSGGWSGEDKYHITTYVQQQMLIRISGAEALERKRTEFETMKRLDGADILMSRPIRYGLCGGGKYSYLLTTFIPGMPLEEAITGMDDNRKYELGRMAGQAMRRIHEVPASGEQENWFDRYNRKIDAKIAAFAQCGESFENLDNLLEYINNTRHKIENRGQTLQHGDFHIGNMVLTDDGQIGIIDFNRLDYGDPWEEFNRIVWCAQSSPDFARGRVDGYFGCMPPDDFFELFSLYVFVNLLSSIPWAVKFGGGEVETMRRQINDVSVWHNGFKNAVPSWYNKNS